MKKIISNSELETFTLGKKFGRRCRGGEVFLLCGGLGAGKTKFVQGLAEGLGVKGRVNSPTFNILKLYRRSGGNFCHVDAYRINSGHDLEDLGIREYLGVSGTVTAIEWAEKVKIIWPVGAKVFNFLPTGENRREIIWRANS